MRRPNAASRQRCVNQAEGGAPGKDEGFPEGLCVRAAAAYPRDATDQPVELMIHRRSTLRAY